MRKILKFYEEIPLNKFFLISNFRLAETSDNITETSIGGISDTAPNLEVGIIYKIYFMKLLYFFLFSLILVACQNTPIKAQNQHQTLVGALQNGNAVLTIDKPKMLATYNANLLRLSEIDGKFTDLTIKTTSDKQYFLVFKGATYSSSFRVTEVSSKLYADDGISCTTSECASEDFGCTPSNSGVSCYPCGNKGKCTKTVSSVSLLD